MISNLAFAILFLGLALYEVRPNKFRQGVNVVRKQYPIIFWISWGALVFASLMFFHMAFHKS